VKAGREQKIIIGKLSAFGVPSSAKVDFSAEKEPLDGGGGGGGRRRRRYC